jgi:hypothetical protein
MAVHAHAKYHRNSSSLVKLPVRRSNSHPGSEQSGPLVAFVHTMHLEKQLQYENGPILINVGNELVHTVHYLQYTHMWTMYAPILSSQYKQHIQERKSLGQAIPIRKVEH